MTNTIIDQLQEATDGLLMMNESEYPYLEITKYKRLIFIASLG